MKRSNLIAAALALVLVLGASIGTTWAYFTTYATAKGGYPIELSERTQITETLSSWTKHVTISAADDSVPTYVRSRAFCGEEYSLTYEGSGWTYGGDGWYYYDAILEGGGQTEPLDIGIEGVPVDAVAGEDFHVIVVYESTRVRYNEAGEPYADWNTVLSTRTTEGE